MNVLRRFPSTSPRQRGRLRRVSPRLPQLPRAGSEQVAGPRLSGHAGGVHRGGALLCPLPVLPKHDQLQNFQDLVRREDVRCSSKNYSEFRGSDSRTLNRVRDPPSVGLCEAARVARPVPRPCLAAARKGSRASSRSEAPSYAPPAGEWGGTRGHWDTVPVSPARVATPSWVPAPLARRRVLGGRGCVFLIFLRLLLLVVWALPLPLNLES